MLFVCPDAQVVKMEAHVGLPNHEIIRHGGCATGGVTKDCQTCFTSGCSAKKECPALFSCYVRTDELIIISITYQCRSIKLSGIKVLDMGMLLNATQNWPVSDTKY